MTLSDSQTLNRGDDIWNRQMTFQLCAGCVFFVLSWVSFEFFNKRVIAQGVSQESPHRVFDLFSRKRQSHRVWGNALCWKSWQFLGGGWPWLMVRLLTIPILTTLIALLIRYGFDERLEAETVIGTMLFISGAFFVVDTIRQFGTVLNHEIYRQTMSSLLMLPLTPYAVVSRLSLGLLPSILPPLLWFCGSWLGLFFITPVSDWDDIVRALFEPWVMHFATWFLLTVHLGVTISTFLRYGGMVLAAALLWVAAPICFGIMMTLIAFLMSGPNGRGAEALFRFLVPYSLMFLELVACGLLQKLIVKRVCEVGSH